MTINNTFHISPNDFTTLVAFARLDDRFATKAREKEVLALLSGEQAKNMLNLIVQVKNNSIAQYELKNNKFLRAILILVGRKI